LTGLSLWVHINNCSGLAKKIPAKEPGMEMKKSPGSKQSGTSNKNTLTLIT